VISSQMGGENEHASVGVLEFTTSPAAMNQTSQCVPLVTIRMLVVHMWGSTLEWDVCTQLETNTGDRDSIV